MNILTSSLQELRGALQSKKLSALELTKAYLQQIEKWNGKINALISVSDKAERQAAEADQRIRAGTARPLEGMPVAIKDMLCTAGLRTTAGSKMLSEFVPPYSATVVQRLEAAGAITIGKCNQDEFAMGSSNETSYFGPCRNPWNLEYVAGGSSGGSAASVAAGMAPLAIGTDTGGSIRQPAHFCGIVGVKPTYGRVSRYGIIAFASSLDQAGPMARTVYDSALVLESICGHDPKDATTAQVPVPAFSQHLQENLKGLKIGLPKEYFNDSMNADAQRTLKQVIAMVKDAGAEIVEVSLPLTSHAVSVYYIVATSEASSNLARYDGVRFGYRADFAKNPATDLAEFYCRTRGEGFGTEVKRRIILGTYALSSGYYDAFYQKACQVRRLLREEFMRAFKTCDVLLSPVATTSAFKLGEKISNPLQMYLNDIYTTSTNLVGIPGMSVPAGFTADGLPIGVQLSAAHFEEQKMLNVALAIENRAGVKNKVAHVLQ